MKDFLSRDYYWCKIHISLIKSSIYPPTQTTPPHGLPPRYFQGNPEPPSTSSIFKKS